MEQEAMPTNTTPIVDSCETWRHLLSNPEGLVELSEEAGEALASHVDGCEACRKAGETARFGAFHVLAREAAGHALDVDFARDLDRVLSDSRDDVERAVAEVLVPQLNDDARVGWTAIVSELADARPSPAVVLSRAIDSVALLIDRYPEPGESPRLVMTSSGAVRIDEHDEIPVSTITAEIRRSASVSATTASLIAAWLPDAVRSIPTLFRGIETEIERGPNGIELALHLVERDNAEPLVRRWAPAASRDELRFELDALEQKARQLLSEVPATETQGPLGQYNVWFDVFREFLDQDAVPATARRAIRDKLARIAASLSSVHAVAEGDMATDADLVISSGASAILAAIKGGATPARAGRPAYATGGPTPDGAGGDRRRR